MKYIIQILKFGLPNKNIKKSKFIFFDVLLRRYREKNNPGYQALFLKEEFINQKIR